VYVCRAAPSVPAPPPVPVRPRISGRSTERFTLVLSLVYDFGENLRQDLKSAIEAVASAFPPGAVEKDPSFPDLLHQPDLLIVPRPGRLIAVYAYLLDSSGGHATYEAIEDVFEAKLVVGESTVVAGLLVGELVQYGKREFLYSVLKGICDVFGQFEGFQQITQDFVPLLRNSAPNDNRAPLWTSERTFVSMQLKRFNEEKYRVVSDASNNPLFRGLDGERRVLNMLRHVFAGEIGTKIEIEPSPNSLAVTLPSRSITRFDFLINGTPIEFVSFEQRWVAQRVRRLMAVARLLRYQDPARSMQSLPFRTVFLIVDGNVAGPARDRYRYVRALVSAGWEVVHLSQLDLLPQLIRHGEL
jgi:hypothetical protein